MHAELWVEDRLERRAADSLRRAREFAPWEGSDHSCTFRDVTFAGGVKHRFEKGEVRGRKQDRNPGIVLAINESLGNP